MATKKKALCLPLADVLYVKLILLERRRKEELLVFSRASSALQNFLNAHGKDNKRNGEQHESRLGYS